MPKLNLKPTHKPIRDYYATLQQYDKHNATHEGAVSNPFAFLLDTCAKQIKATLIPQYAMRTAKGNRIVIDGVVLDEYGLPFAYWEAKDIDDDLVKAVHDKRDAGYPPRQYPLSNPATRHFISKRTKRLRRGHHRTDTPDCCPSISVFLRPARARQLANGCLRFQRICT